MKCINLTIAFCLSIFTTVFAQSPLVVMSSSKEYKNRVKESSDHQMLELKYAIPQMVYDLRYATPLNFMHRRMYPKNTNSTFFKKACRPCSVEGSASAKQNALGHKSL